MPSEKIKILSFNDEVFIDRQEAGKLLASALKEYKGKGAVVLGIPRGGVVVADVLSRELEADLDVVITRKIGHPFNSEFAIGAVSESGDMFINESISALEVDKNFLNKEKNIQLKEIKRRIDLFRKIKPKVLLKDKIVIVCDDGLATGATMQASLMVIKKELPKRILVALPVAPEESLKIIQNDADEILCLRVPTFFAAVGQFYKNFSQVSDKEVIDILKNFK